MINIFKLSTLNITISLAEEFSLSRKVGIDIGQSLTKFAFLEKDTLVLLIGKTKNNFSQIFETIETLKSKFDQFNFTGGKAFKVFKKYENIYHCRLINEFEANVKGIEFIYQNDRSKSLPPSLIITIGTGTSMVLKNDEISHIGGSALGGGFFMGIAKVLYNIEDYQQAINIAKKGNRYNVDLKVKDIYDSQDSRVDPLFMEFTASSLGKIDIDVNLNSIRKEDILNSLLCLIGENIGSLASIQAKSNNLRTIVCCGGFLINNNLLITILKMICRINRQKLISLENSEFSGAIGALIY
ncbi:MAG: hypothetical protein ACFE8E_11735 [Candidatus Hodarchaeota archaeon]